MKISWKKKSLFTFSFLSLEVKQLGHEADHSPPSSAKVKNVWSYTSTPPVHLHGVVLS
jgi:hypothetical protein